MTSRQSRRRQVSAADVEPISYRTVTLWTVVVIVIAVAIGLMLEPG